MRVLILANNDMGLYKFRKELLEELVKKHKVYFCVPKGEFVEDICKIGCKFIECLDMDRHGTNPVKELKLMSFYLKVIKRIKPDIVFTYTIKCNAYGGMACALAKVPYVANITGLGTAIENGGILSKVSSLLYKIGLVKAQKVFFQNEENKEFMLSHRIVKGAYDVLPGSGVNTEQHCYEPYPKYDQKIVFTTIGRIMKDKGIDEILGAAEIIKKEYPNVVFRLIGDFDENFKEKVKQAQGKNIIEYLGFQNDIHPFIADSHAILHASYHEGMSNVLLESASTGRPVIATNVHGCIETYDPDVTGIAYKPRSTIALVKAIRKFLKLPHEEKEKMGLLGREKVVREFSRQIIIDKYLKEIEIVK